jgi:CRP-like cAMP-binding protein
VREGGHGKWIWVILNGTVEVRKETPSGPMCVIRLGEGCFIGTLSALSFMDRKRNASVFAVGDVHLGLLDTERLSREYTSLSPQFRGLLLSLEERLRKLSERVVELSSGKDSMKGAPKDMKVAIKKGSLKKVLFSIHEGEAYVLGQNQKGPLPLMTLQKGDVFGYVPFMDIGHEPRTAWVLASEDLNAIEIDTEGLQKEYDRLSGTLRNMIYYVGTAIFATTKLLYRVREQ